MDEVLAAAAGYALPVSFLGYVAPFFFRHSRVGSIAAGVIGAISLPIVMSVSGAVPDPPDPAEFFFSIGYGALAGWIWYLLSKKRAN